MRVLNTVCQPFVLLGALVMVGCGNGAQRGEDLGEAQQAFVAEDCAESHGTGGVSKPWADVHDGSNNATVGSTGTTNYDGSMECTDYFTAAINNVPAGSLSNWSVTSTDTISETDCPQTYFTVWAFYWDQGGECDGDATIEYWGTDAWEGSWDSSTHKCVPTFDSGDSNLGSTVTLTTTEAPADCGTTVTLVGYALTFGSPDTIHQVTFKFHHS